MPTRPDSFFGGDIDKRLKEKLPKEHVLEREAYKNGPKLSYLPAHYVINQANEIFGFGMWGTEIIHMQQLDKTEYQKAPYNAGEKPKDMIAFAYMCRMKLTVRAGEHSNSYEDVGFGSGVANASAAGIHSALELAIKEASTDALKRCMRLYGNQFGLSLYDKSDDYMPTLSEVEAARPVTEEQLRQLRDLYHDRGIDDEWVLAYLKGEHYPNRTLEEMRNDWFQLAYEGARQYKLDEINAEAYEEDIARVIGLIKESTTMGMLKAMFAEAWDKAKKADDKPRQLEAQQAYEAKKAELEPQPETKTEDKSK